MMQEIKHALGVGALLAALLANVAIAGDDVDNTDDCKVPKVDFGDAPEGIRAYPKGSIPFVGEVIGHFPTCITQTPPGNQNIDCVGTHGTVPGLTGYVVHNNAAPILDAPFWLGCIDIGGNRAGIDTDNDAKVSIDGAAVSECGAPQTVDSFDDNANGQDEIQGGDDSGLMTAPEFQVCSNANSFSLRIANCGGFRTVYVNVLVDWNGDGDWNDVVTCCELCATEWPVLNQPIDIVTGCNDVAFSGIQSSSRAGPAWVRITLTGNPVPADFPWRGSLGTPVGAFAGGETEDYQFLILGGNCQPCPNTWLDRGDAPEGIEAYPLVVGAFPTCPTIDQPGDIELCNGLTIPFTAGAVRNRTEDATPRIQLGCNLIQFDEYGVDSEAFPKYAAGGLYGLGDNPCNCLTFADVIEVTPWNTVYGQDEATNDELDAGLAMSRNWFRPCAHDTIRFVVKNCEATEQQIYVNILVDWNHDGDWGDELSCASAPVCNVLEWTIQNRPVTLAPGCNTLEFSDFLSGPDPGPMWMRISVSLNEAPPNFPSKGTEDISAFEGGETEDYPVEIRAMVDVPVVGRTGSAVSISLASSNPSTGGMRLRCMAGAGSPLEVAVYDSGGRRVRLLSTGWSGTGEHLIAWDGKDDAGKRVRSGVYYVRIEQGDASSAVKVAMLPE